MKSAPLTSIDLTNRSVLSRLYSAYGNTGGIPDMRWTVDLAATVLEIDTGSKMLRINRDEALALLSCINAALPHMAVELSENEKDEARP